MLASHERGQHHLGEEENRKQGKQQVLAGVR